MNKVRKLENDNKVYVAVLVSPDFGAGWSTWNNNHPEILFDPVVVNHLNPLYGTPYDAEKYNMLTEYLMDKYDYYFRIPPTDQRKVLILVQSLTKHVQRILLSSFLLE